MWNKHSLLLTLNRRKLRALSNDLRKSLVKQENENGKDEENAVSSAPTNSNELNGCSPSTAKLPNIYERAHAFKVHTFKGLNWCEVCANFLWGFTAQGVKCEDCGFIAHNKCSELVPVKCVSDLKRIRGVFGTDLTIVAQPYQCSIPFVIYK